MQVSNMKTIAQTSPVAHAQLKSNATWALVNGINTAVEFAGVEVEQARKKILGVTDVSCLSRYGVKGAQAAKWLADHQVTTPANPNSWSVSDQNTLVLRLGGSEFLLEDQFGGSACARLSGDTNRVPNVYKVPRADAAFILSGSEVLNMLSELCALDLREKALGSEEVIMTQIAGISAIVLRQDLNGEQVYRIWCDGTYGPYLWDVMVEIAVELGGGAVGLACYQS